MYLTITISAQALHQLKNLQDLSLKQKIELEMKNTLIKVAYMKHAAVFHGLLPWLSKFPRIQSSAGYPWSYRKIAEGMLLLKEMEKGQQLLSKAVRTFLLQKKNTSNSTVPAEGQHIPEKKDGEPVEHPNQQPEDVAGEQAEASESLWDFRYMDGIFPLFKSLRKHFKRNDNVAVDHLKKILLGCKDIDEGDLHNIITHYRMFFESCIFIASALQLEEAADQIRRLLDGIPDKLDQIAARPSHETNPVNDLNAFLERSLALDPGTAATYQNTKVDFFIFPKMVTTRL